MCAKTDDAEKKVADRVAEVAKHRGIPRARIALAWLLSKPVITAPIVGATKLNHLDFIGLGVVPVRAEFFALTTDRRWNSRREGSAAEEPMVCTTLRWREMDSNHQYPEEKLPLRDGFLSPP